MKHLFLPFNILFLGLLILPFTSYSQTNGANVPLPMVASMTGKEKILPIYFYDLTIPVDVLFGIKDAKRKHYRKRNFVFEFYIKNDTVTLHGWRFRRASQRKNQYEKFTPGGSDVFLRPISQSNVVLGSDVLYLSNQVFYAKDVKNMMRDIKNKKLLEPILLFTPVKDTATKRITYQITFKKLSGQGTGINDSSYSTNPSPPHQSFDN